MFSDTHCHLSYLEERGIDCVALLQMLAAARTPFVLDAGTRCTDLCPRTALAESYIARISGPDSLKETAAGMLHFAAGIWPDAEAVRDRHNQIASLQRMIGEYRQNCARESKPDALVAVGECGLDHHWNVAGADARDSRDFAGDMLKNEAELFELQLDFARRLQLPVIVHSRDAFSDTAACIKDAGYHNGVIHCFSYGKDEARVFLDMGWYISFSGSITYAKKQKLEEMRALIRYIPHDRILLETDAPYLAPVPERGSTNTPLFIAHTYRFAAEAAGLPVEQLCALVAENAGRLFCRQVQHSLPSRHQ